jgi:FtsH-binding integral membrane protein
MSWLVFVLQVLPVTGLAFVATLAGFALPVSEAMRIPLLLVGVLLFAGLMTFRRTRGWNLALLLGLAVVAGSLMGSALDDAHVSWTGATALMAALVGLAALIGRALQDRLRRAGFVLWVLAWIVLAGWLIGGLLHPEEWLRILWACAGLVIFGGLAAVWFSRLGSEEIPPRGLAVALGCDLYLLGLNIAVAGQVLIDLLPFS